MLSFGLCVDNGGASVRNRVEEKWMDYLYLAVPIAMLLLVFSAIVCWRTTRKGDFGKVDAAVRCGLRQAFLDKQQDKV